MRVLVNFTVAACFVGLLGSAGCDRQTAQPAGAPGAASATPAAVDRVVAGKPVKKTLKRYTSQPGRIEAFEEAPLYSKLTGYVEQVLVDIGDIVKKDQLLVKLSIPELVDEEKQMEALVAQAEADIAQSQAAEKASEAAGATAEAKVVEARAGVGRAEAEYERWQAEYGRLKELAGHGSVTPKLVDETLNQSRAADASRQEAAANVKSAEAAAQAAGANVQKAEADVVAAKARLQVARANLAHAKTMLAYREIKSPFNGTITKRSVDVGHYVHPVAGATAEPLLVVSQTKRVRVFVDVPEAEAGMVDAGEKGDMATVHVESLGGKDIEGRVTRTSWSVERTNRSLRTEIDLANEGGKLRPGMYAKVDILLDHRTDVLTLPTAAIVRYSGATYCFVVDAGKVHRTPIELGLVSGPDVEVRKGVAADQIVVLARADALKDGQTVEVMQPAQ
jgi:HlyD family secretion protein